MILEDIVMKLIGPISPVGDTSVDGERFNNLQTLCTLVDRLLYQINSVSLNDESDQYSVNKAGKFASNFLKQVKEI